MIETLHGMNFADATPSQLNDLILHKLESSVQDSKLISQGNNNFVFDLTLESGTSMILRIAKPDELLPLKVRLENQVAAMRLVASTTDIPVPRVIACWIHDEDTAEEAAFMIVEKMNGGLAEVIAKLQSIKTTWYGGFAVGPDDSVVAGPSVFGGIGPFESVGEYYSAKLSDAFQFAKKNPLLQGYKDAPFDSRARIQKLIGSSLDHFFSESDVSPVFIHGDMHLGNVLIDPETKSITALLDFEFASSSPASEEFEMGGMVGYQTGPLSETTEPAQIERLKRIYRGWDASLEPKPTSSEEKKEFALWNQALALAGALRPSTLPSHSTAVTLWILSQEICPWYLDARVIERWKKRSGGKLD
ncbi:hypothetical protein HK100_005713, partial [Physocladia obscura]